MMNELFVLAQAASAPDAGTVGVSLTGLIGSLGAAGAAVIVTYYFLRFLKDQGKIQARMFQDFKDFHADSQKKIQEQVERLTDDSLQLAVRVIDSVVRQSIDGRANESLQLPVQEK
jgi:uncharacterized protein (DUF2141 family)